jgi:hypothetical protein
MVKAFSLGLAAFCAATASAHSCISDSGDPVAWWFTYKLPDAGNDPNADNGFAYAYADDNKCVVCPPFFFFFFFFWLSFLAVIDADFFFFGSDFGVMGRFFFFFFWGGFEL